MNRSSRHASLFLMELIAALLMFSLAAALCLQMFAKAHSMQKNTDRLHMASSQARNAAELMKRAAEPGGARQDDAYRLFTDCIAKEYPHAIADDGQMRVHFDADWNHCIPDDGAYRMDLSFQDAQQEGLFCCNIAVFQTGESPPVYSLDLKLHVPNQP